MRFPALPALFPAALLAMLPVASPTQAQTLEASDARGQLYHPERVEVLRYDTRGLSDDEVTVLITVAQAQKYYAAVAFAPDAGIMADPTVMASNYHSTDAAREAALRDCNDRRSGGARCIIALEVRPAGWEPRDLTLSADATVGFNDSYRRARGTRAFAISATTGLWGIGQGDGAQDAAIAACAGDSGVSDCAIVIAD